MASITRTGMIYHAMDEEKQERWKQEGIYYFQNRPVSFDIVTDGAQLSVPDSLACFNGAVIFIHGTKDELIPYKQIPELAKHHPGDTTIRFIEGADHRFSQQEHRKQVVEIISKWVTDTFH